MERTKEMLEARVRETPLGNRLKECQKRIGNMCAELRGPKMSIPVEYYDDDFYICTTLADAQATVEALQAQLESANTLLHKKNCAIGKAETTIEALQRELAYANECRTADASMTDQLKMELDAEREKVKGLEAHMNRLDKHKAWLLGHCRKLRHDIQFEQRTARDFQDLWRTACDQREAFETQLSQLQALVETIKCELFDRYDGAPDSPTRWMGSLIRDIKIAQALPATPTEEAT